MLSSESQVYERYCRHWRKVRANYFAVLLYASYFLYLAFVATHVYKAAASLPIGWPILWLLCIATMIAGPFFPEVGPLIYLVLAYGMPRYSEVADIANQLTLSETIAYLALAAFLIHCLVERAAPLIKDKFTGWSIVLWCIVALSAANAVWLQGRPWDPLQEDPMGQFNQILILGLLSRRLFNTRDSVLKFAVVIIFVLIFRAATTGLWHIEGDHDFPFVIVVSLPFLLILTSAPSWPMFARLLQCCIALAFSVLVVLSRNRGSIVALPPLMLFLWLRSSRKLLLGAAGLAIAIFVAAASPLQYYIERFAGFGTDETSLSRIVAWKGAINMVAAHPLLGVGLGNFQPLSQQYAGSKLAEQIVAHNNFFHIAGESGLLGLIAYTALIILTFAAAVRLCRSSIEWFRVWGRIIELSMIAYLVAGTFISRHNFVLAYMIMGLATAIWQSLRQFEAAEVAAAESPLSTNSGKPVERSSIL